MNILFITTVLPSGMRGGGEVWSQTIVDGLRRLGAFVRVMGYQRTLGTLGCEEVCIDQRTVETSRARLAALSWGGRAILSRRPYTVQKWMGASYAAAIKRALVDRRWDLVIIDHAGSAWALDQFGDIPVVHLSHQAEAELYKRHAAGSRGLKRRVFEREADLVAQLESKLTQRAAAIWCISEGDAAWFNKIRAGKAIALPPLPRSDWPTDDEAVPEHAPDVVLLGSWTWKPNREALRWFLREVQPLLPREWVVTIGGKHNPSDFADFPAAPFVGVVKDPCAFLRFAKRIAVPSLVFVGAPLKLVDAIAAGRPVTTNLEAVQQVGAVPSHVQAATSASEFADALRQAGPVEVAENRTWLCNRQAVFDHCLQDSLARINGAAA